MPFKKKELLLTLFYLVDKFQVLLKLFFLKHDDSFYDPVVDFFGL